MALAARQGPAALGDPGVHRVLDPVRRRLQQRVQDVRALGRAQSRTGINRSGGRYVEQLPQGPGQQHRILVLYEDQGARGVQFELVQRDSAEEHGRRPGRVGPGTGPRIGPRIGSCIRLGVRRRSLIHGVAAQAFGEPPGQVRVPAHDGGEPPRGGQQPGPRVVQVPARGRCLHRLGARGARGAGVRPGQ